MVKQLKWVVEGGAQPTRVVPSAGVSGWRQSITVGLSVVVGVLLGALLGIGFGSLTSSNPPSMKRFLIQTPVDQRLGRTSTADPGEGDVAGSPTAATGEDPAARQALQSKEQIDKPAPVATNQSDSTDVERSPAPTEQSPTNQLGSTSTRAVGFAVQIAASRTRQKAEKSRTLWERRGYTAYVVETDIPGSGHYYRVRVGRFDTQEEAREVASNMQSRLPQELPDFWIVPYQK